MAGGGTASFSFDNDDCGGADDDHDDFSDPGRGVSFHMTEVASMSFDDVLHAITIVGTGTDNGIPVGFSIVVSDSLAEPPGTFSIALSDGYAAGGPLTSGSIQVQ